MGDWIDISRSAWLDAAKYDESTAEAEGRASMFLRLKTGVEIEVLDVTPRVWREFMGSQSRGRFYHRVIAPSHVKRVVS